MPKNYYKRKYDCGNAQANKTTTNGSHENKTTNGVIGNHEIGGSNVNEVVSSSISASEFSTPEIARDHIKDVKLPS